MKKEKKFKKNINKQQIKYTTRKQKAIITRLHPEKLIL
jgi:hypothetical protein